MADLAYTWGKRLRLSTLLQLSIKEEERELATKFCLIFFYRRQVLKIKIYNRAADISFSKVIQWLARDICLAKCQGYKSANLTIYVVLCFLVSLFLRLLY